MPQVELSKDTMIPILKTYKYIICLLDLKNNRQQSGIFILETPNQIDRVCIIFGLSGKLKQALGLRWEIHISPLAAVAAEDKLMVNCIRGVVDIVRTILKQIDYKPNKSVIVLPANNPR